MRRRISYQTWFVWSIYLFGILTLPLWLPRIIQNPRKLALDLHFQVALPILFGLLVRRFFKKPSADEATPSTLTPEEEDLEFVEGLAACCLLMGAVFVACTLYLAAGRLMSGAGWRNDAASVCLTGAALIVVGYLARTLARWHLLRGVRAARRTEWVRKHDLEIVTVICAIIQTGAGFLAFWTLAISAGGVDLRRVGRWSLLGCGRLRCGPVPVSGLVASPCEEASVTADRMADLQVEPARSVATSG